MQSDYGIVPSCQTGSCSASKSLRQAATQRILGTGKDFLEREVNRRLDRQRHTPAPELFRVGARALATRVFVDPRMGHIGNFENQWQIVSAKIA